MLKLLFLHGAPQAMRLFARYPTFVFPSFLLQNVHRFPA
jgi:hypothetical protein